MPVWIKPIQKILLEEPGQNLQTVVNQAAWTHNTSTHVGGYTPLTLATGKAIFYPGLSESDEATSAMCDSEAIKKVITRTQRIHEEFMKSTMES